MPDYSKSKIYAIRAPGTADVYIGSTTKTLSARMANHRSHYKRWIEDKHNWICSFLLLGYENAYIELIENFPCESREQLNKREGEIMRMTDCCINSQSAGNTNAETTAKWRFFNREKDNENARLWRKKNPDKLKAIKERYKNKQLE